MKISRTLPIRIGFVLAAAGVLTLSACSSSASPESAGSTASATNVPTQQQMGGGGVSGEIAALSGSTLQVQDTDSQTAVSYTDSTTITQSVAAALADVTSGVCVTSISGDFGGGSGSGDSSSSDSTDAASTAASTVLISTAVDGACSIGFGGGAGGGMPGGGTPPTDLPDGGAIPTDAPDGVMPTGAPGDGAGAGGFGGFASGLVTAVSGSTITVQTTDADGANATSDITVDDSTTYTKTVSADSSALVVGACVTVMGESDDSGAVAATTLAVSEAGDSGCSTGFGGPGGGQRPGAGSGTSTSGS